MKVLLLQKLALLFDVRTRDQKKKAMYANSLFLKKLQTLSVLQTRAPIWVVVIETTKNLIFK
jgi:hypothetical protein